MFHLFYLHRLSHGCRDGLTLWPDMLVSPRFPFLIPSLSGSTVRRWFFLSIHMLVWISKVTQIWCYQLASSGVLVVNSLTISLFIVSFYNFLMLSSIRTNKKLMCSCRCWTSSASSTAESANCRSSRRGCGKGYPS